ncbi:DUF3313 domain-containing protein [Corallincola platygyrae]|uniref:DUF3313 domain-containing protein n=1 Tax=Corallincola platygyrae TaxID=1193278 RepID=A0ABW4XPH6_9GAMM
MLKPLALTLSIALLGACASAPETQETFSGYLEDYSKLKPVPDDDTRLAWYADDYDVANYASVEIQDAKIWLSPKLSDEEGIAADKQAAFAEYLVKALDKDLPGAIETGAEGTNTLIVKPAITGFSSGSADLEFYQYLPITLLVAGAMEASGNRDEVPVLFLEAEAVDKESGKVVAQTVRRLAGDDVDPEVLKEQGIEAFYPQLDAWAKQLTSEVKARAAGK